MHIRPESFAFIILLGAMGGLTPLGIDMGLPALQAMGQSLLATPAAAALTLSFFLFGFACGPMMLGPLSDRFGRRPVLLGGCAIYAVAGAGCALSPTIHLLLAWRLLQGMGAGAAAILCVAIVRDLFDGALARSRLSYVATVGTLTPMIAPTLGVFVLGHWGWRAIYGFMAITGVVLWAAVYFGYSESNKALDRSALHPKTMFTNYRRVFQHRLCLGYLLIASLSFGCIFSYISSSPLVMMVVLRVSPSFFGTTFALTSLGIMVGAFLNGKLSEQGASTEMLLKVGLGLSLLSSLTLLGLSLSNHATVSTFLPLLVINTFSIGLIAPNATEELMHPMPEIAGVASAALGSIRMLTGGLAGVLVALLFDGHSTHVMAESMTCFAMASALVYYFLIQRSPIKKSV